MEAAAHHLWADQDPNRSSSKLGGQGQGQGQDQERKVRPKNEQALNCPRCHSTNTKFCYYNNYSLTQPRYFCKACKRYWTAGGSLRNIPVGGASRKNKRSSSSSSTSTIPNTSSSKPTLSHFANSQNPNPNPNNFHKGQDLNLAFQPPQDQGFHHGFSQFLKINSSSNTSTSLSDLLRNGISSGLNPPPNHQTPMPAAGANTMYNNPLGFTFQEFNPTAGFALDGSGMKYGGFNNGSAQGISGGRMMLPFEALTREGDHSQTMDKGNSNGYWNGMLGGGSC